MSADDTTPYSKCNLASEWGPQLELASAGPFKRFSTCVLQNVHVNNIRCAMVCNVCFSFSKILKLY